MNKLWKDDKEFYFCAMRGISAEPKYWKYWIPGIGTIRLKGKIIEALRLGLDLHRLDKLINQKQKFDYISKKWINYNFLIQEENKMTDWEDTINPFTKKQPSQKVIQEENKMKLHLLDEETLIYLLGYLSQGQWDEAITQIEESALDRDTIIACMKYVNEQYPTILQIPETERV